jgi:hypothetical protein
VDETQSSTRTPNSGLLCAGERAYPLVRGLATHRSPGLPGDAQDHERDHKTDDGISNRRSECHNDRGGNDGQAHVGVCSGVGAVRG